jgi:hypothetical protein
MNRYEGEARREFNRTAELLLKKVREDAKAAQSLPEKQVAHMKASADASKRAEATSRNEAKASAVEEASGFPEVDGTVRKGRQVRAQKGPRRRRSDR